MCIRDRERFRQWGSRTPGHPEYGKTPGVEATTGPLGQGLSNAVGMAITEVALAARFNRPGHQIVDHFTYVLASDGDLEEGISSEAGSDAGHLHLGKLIVLYANNHITIEGSTKLAFTEDRSARFAAFGWHVQRIGQGNDVDEIERALKTAREETGRPSLILVRTHIGYGSPHKQDTAAAHGEPLGLEEVCLTKEALGWPLTPTFHIPEEAPVSYTHLDVYKRQVVELLPSQTSATGFVCPVGLFERSNGKNDIAPFKPASHIHHQAGNLPGLIIEEKSADASRLAIGRDDGRPDQCLEFV